MCVECDHRVVQSAAAPGYRRTWCRSCGRALPHEALDTAWLKTKEDALIIPGQQRTVVFLFVCSANVARSATAEHMARQGRCISDSVGSDPIKAVRQLTVETIARARRIICMEDVHAQAVLQLAPMRARDITVWNIPDNYDYCEPALMAEIGSRLAPLIEQWHHQRYLFLGPHGEQSQDQ